MTAMENESSDGNVSPKKKLIRKGKTALARILLLDGSYLDVQIDVTIYITFIFIFFFFMKEVKFEIYINLIIISFLKNLNYIFVCFDVLEESQGPGVIRTSL